jgi:hypothetical protein
MLDNARFGMQKLNLCNVTVTDPSTVLFLTQGEESHMFSKAL